MNISFVCLHSFLLHHLRIASNGNIQKSHTHIAQPYSPDRKHLGLNGMDFLEADMQCI